MVHAKEWTEYKLKVQKGKIGLFKCFQYIDKIDIILMLTGTCCSIFGGCCFSILSIIFGLMTNSLLTHTVEQIFVQNGNTTVNSETSSINMEQFAGMMSFYSNSFFFLALCILISSSMQTFFWEMVAERQVYKLRQILFKQILRQDIGWYDKNDNGNLALKLSDDLERIKEGIGVKMSLVIQCLSLFFSGIATGLMTNWRLTCIILLIGPIMMGMNAYVIKFNANAAAREQKQYGIAGNIANEVLMNIRTVIAFCKEAAEMKRYKKALEAGAKITRSSDLILSYAMGFVYFLICICFGIGFYFGALFMNEGLCTPGSVFTVFFCVISGAFSAGNALPFIHAIAVASGCATSIFDIINRVPDVDPYSKSGLKPVSVNGAIEIKNVSFKYPTRPEVEVLHNLSVTIEQGKIIAFVGSSGAGKSTLIGLLLRFYDPSEGMITLDGIPLQQLNLRWLRNQIGVVAQEPILFSSSIAENIRYGRVDVSQKEIEKAAHLANAHSFISKLPEGYNTLAGIRGSQLSGGQKQRIAIARALVRNPKILLLDEATSALDGHSEEVVQQALEKAMQNRTTIIIAHRMSTVRNADIIYVMKNGYIAENGKHEDLMARKDLYYNFVMAQTLVKNIDEGRNLDSDEYMETKVKPFIREQSISPSVYSEKKCEVQDIPQEIMPKVTIYQLLKMNSKEWSKFIIGIVNGVFCGVMMPIFTVLYSEIFKIFSLPHEQMMPTAVSWAILFPIFGIIYGLSMFTQSYVLSNASTKLIVRLRSKAFNNIIKQSVSWFDLPFSSPNLLITRLARDAPLVKMVAGVRMCHLINANVTIIAGVAISIYFSWRLGLVLACVVPCIIITTFNKQRMTKKLLSRDDKLMENASQIAHECIQNIRTVQALGNEEVFVEQYMESLNLPYKESKKQAFVFGISYGASQAMLYTMYGIGFKYGFYLYQTGNITIINMYKSFFATTFCAGSSGQSLTYLSDYTRAKSAICRMIYLSKLKSKTEPLDHNKIYPIIHGQIEFKNVNFTYPVRTEVNVLKELDFNLEIGKTLAIVGESGSGKSTIISLMERFYDPTSGIIKVDNYNIAELNTCYLRRNIGLVTQEPCLFDRTIKENISYGLLTEEDESVIMQKVIVAAKSVNIHNFIVSLPLGYETMVGEGGTNLSGGQKQRIAIARALVKDPKILLLDEATSALDTENEKIVQEALDIARTNRTCITIAHRLSTIQNADKIAVMSKGKIVESGTHTELINKQNYYYRLTRKQDI